MDEKNTEMLMGILKSAEKGDLKQYREKHLAGTFSGFPAYMDALIEEKQLRRRDIFQKADLPQKYGYKLLSGEKHTSDRDKLLRIFIAMKMTLKETQRALALYGMPSLYPKSVRDAVIIIALNQGISSVDEVNDWLKEQGLRQLSRSAEG